MAENETTVYDCYKVGDKENTATKNTKKSLVGLCVKQYFKRTNTVKNQGR